MVECGWYSDFQLDISPFGHNSLCLTSYHSIVCIKECKINMELVWLLSNSWSYVIQEIKHSPRNRIYGIGLKCCVSDDHMDSRNQGYTKKSRINNHPVRYVYGIGLNAVYHMSWSQPFTKKSSLTITGHPVRTSPNICECSSW